MALFVADTGFVVKEGLKITKRIQVWYEDVSLTTVPDRELNCFRKIPAGCEDAESILLTNDYENVIDTGCIRVKCLPDAGVQIDEKGAFTAEFPPGRYYLVMRKRANQDSAGPPEEGDPQYYARLKNGDPKTFTVKAGKKTNIGTITEATPFRREKTVTRAGMTGIEGTVTDDQGKPLDGLRVFVYESAGMLGMPRYASDQTGQDGRYFLSLTSGGTYFLKARTHYGGGRPDEGEYMGSYGKSGEPGSVTVEKGQIIKGIDILTTRFSSKRKGE